MINYIITAWGGQRRSSNEFNFLKLHLEHLCKLSHNLSQITIVNNKLQVEVCPEYTQTLEDIKKGKYDFGCPLVFLERENIGLSYGAFSYAYGLYRQKFDYYIFMEDDYIFVKDNFDQILIDLIEEKGPQCGYVCGIVRDRGTDREHAGCSIGIIRSSCLEKVWEMNEKIPHDFRSGYEEQGGQIIFSNSMIDAGYTLEEFYPKYGCAMWWPRDVKDKGVLGREYPGPALFLPIQASQL